jgi:hypothetical protein
MACVLPGQVIRKCWCSLGGKTQLSFSLGILCHGDEQHTGQQKANISVLGTHFGI